jgi:hypothetical protein
MQFNHRKECIMKYRTEQRLTGGIVTGMLFIIFGALLLLHKLDIFYLDAFGINSFWDLWPVIFIFIGLSKLANAPSVRHMGEGVWWIFLGTWFYVSVNHVYGLSFHQTWPAVIIAWGISVLWQSFKRNRKEKEYNYGK